MEKENLSAEAALEEAYARVEYAKLGGDRSLNLSDLRNLERLPETISHIGHIERLNIAGTKIADLEPLRACENITFIDADHSLLMDIGALEGKSDLFTFSANKTPLADISPLSHAKGLYAISLNGTPIRDISVFSGLASLSHVSLGNTLVSDLSPLRDNASLTILDIKNTKVSNLNPLRGSKKLLSLDITGTEVSDLSPVADISTLFSQSSVSGIDIRGAIRLPEEIKALADLPVPARSMKISEILKGVSSSIVDFESLQDASEANIGQRPAAFTFSLDGGVVTSAPYHVQASDVRLSSDIRRLVVEKIDFALELLVGNEADALLDAALRGIQAELSRGSEDLRDGVVLMRFRTLETFALSYESAESGRSERLRAAVLDVSTSLEDFLATLPSVSQIDANRQALGFQSEPQNIKLLQDNLAKIEAISKSSGIVSDAALGALLESTREVSILNDVIRSTSNEVMRSKAIQRQASLAGLQALNLRNFAAAPIRYLIRELGPVTADSWKAAKQAIPKGVGSGVEGLVSGGIRSAPALLVASLAGPLSGLIVLAATFAPLARLAARIGQGVDETQGDD